MNSKQTKPGRVTRALTALTALAGAAAILAAPAGAASGEGSASIIFAKHSKGRTLSGQGVRVLAEAPATKAGKLTTLTIDELDPGAKATAQASGGLNFKHGKKTVALTGIHFDFSSGALAGKLGGSEVQVFRLGGGAAINSTAGSIVLNGGKLRLTKEGAGALKEKLGLRRALRHKGVGMIWISAQANPTYAAAQPVKSGSLNWGVLASWRKYVATDSPAPGPPDTGEVTVSGGASINGEVAVPSSFFSFPVTGGTYQKGLYGAADKLTLQTQGAVKFAKPMHCIDEVLFSGVDLKIDGSSSDIVLDAKNEVGEFNGMGCTGKPAASASDVAFATIGSVTPTYSGDGKTVTWTGIPSTLTQAGSTAWGVGAPYIPGKVLDTVTATVNIG